MLSTSTSYLYTDAESFRILTARLYQLPKAEPVTNNPIGLVAEAVLPEDAFFKDTFPNGGNIKGKVVAKSGEGGVGVQFDVELSNLPEGGPFSRFPDIDSLCWLGKE